MPDLRMMATDEGIHRSQPVDKALLQQEIERAIDRGRRRPEILGAELVEERVGADRLVARPDEFQHTAAQRREAKVPGGAQFLGRGDRVLDTVLVIVGMPSGRRSRRFFQGTSDLPTEDVAIIRAVPSGGQGSPLCPMVPQ